MKGINKIAAQALILIFVFITTNVSAQWVQTSGPAGININVLFKSGNIIFAGTKALGVYKSIDNGATWLSSTTGLENSDVRSFVFLNGAFYAASFGPTSSLRGVFKSTNSGQSWTRLSGMAGKSITSLAVHDNYIFAGTPFPDGGLFRSDDFGANWVNLVSNSIISVDYLFVNKNVILATEDGYIWYSNNNGKNWHLQYQFGNYIISMAAIGDTIISARSLLRSNNNGITWSNLPQPGPGETYSLASINKTFYAGTTTGIFKSTDFGNTWNPSQSGLGNGTVQSLISDNKDLYAALVNNSAGVYKSVNAGKNWFASGTGFAAASTIRSMVAKDKYIFANVEYDGIYRSSDDGDAWTKLDTNNTLLKTALAHAMCVKNGVLIAGTNKGIFRSINNGDTWTRITDGFPQNATSIIIFDLAVSGKNIVATVETLSPNFQSAIYYSNDDGLSWHISDLSYGSVRAVGCNGNHTCFTVVSTVGTENGLYRSSDDGITWIPNIFYYNNPDVINITGSGNNWMMSTLFSTSRSTNNGIDWIPSNVPGGAIFTFTQLGKKYVFGGNQFGMFATQDWGITWQNISTGLLPNTDVEASCINNKYLFAGTSDHAVWRRRLSDLSGGANPKITLENISITPNPVTNYSATVTYNLMANGNVELTITDISGNIKQINQAGNRLKGIHNYAVSGLNKLLTGNYFIVLKQNGQVIARSRFVITR